VLRAAKAWERWVFGALAGEGDARPTAIDHARGTSFMNSGERNLNG